MNQVVMEKLGLYRKCLSCGFPNTITAVICQNCLSRNIAWLEWGGDEEQRHSNLQLQKSQEGAEDSKGIEEEE